MAPNDLLACMVLALVTGACNGGRSDEERCATGMNEVEHWGPERWHCGSTRDPGACGFVATTRAWWYRCRRSPILQVLGNPCGFGINYFDFDNVGYFMTVRRRAGELGVRAVSPALAAADRAGWG